VHQSILVGLGILIVASETLPVASITRRPREQSTLSESAVRIRELPVVLQFADRYLFRRFMSCTDFSTRKFSLFF
jgi:hypothetical protein